MRVAFKEFRGVFSSWHALYREAAEFATTLGPDRVINISTYANQVVVWYWTDD